MFPKEMFSAPRVNTSFMNNTIISLAVHKSGGGPTKTIGAFKRALGAELYTFCDPSKVENDPLVVPGANPVNALQLPFARQFMWPSNKSAAAAEEAYKESSLISCHSFYRYHILWMNRMHKKYGVPYWFVPHGILDPWVMERGRYVKKTFWCFGGQRFLNEASTLIFATQAELDKAASQFELPGADVVPWPVDLVDLSNAQKCRELIRQELRIPEDARVLLYFGRMHSMKCPLETIEAMARAGNQNLHLIMLGNAQDVTLEDCAKDAREHGVQKRVHVIGPVYGGAKYNYLFAADAYISLSWRENFNHTAAESLAAGMPVILSSGNDLVSEIREQNCSWALEGNSVTSAVEAIQEFAELPKEELQAMGQRGRNWVEATLSFDNFKSKLLEVAERITGH